MRLNDSSCRFGAYTEGNSLPPVHQSALNTRPKQHLHSSFVSELRIGAPQGSVLGPRSFVAYTGDVTNVFEQHRVRHNLFADDMQGIKYSKPSNVCHVTAGLRALVSVTSVKNWCVSKRLQLNTKKTEVMWHGPATNLRKISSVDKDLLVGSDIISPDVRDLGVFFDSELNMKSHIIIYY